MNKKELNALLAELDHEPKRSLGQNFLLEKSFAASLVKHLKIESGDLVVEVGPGLGALTEHLVESPAGEILLLEKDSTLAFYLDEKYCDDPRVRVVECDALEFDLRRLCSGKRVILIGNLPYNVSTAILAHFGSPTSPVQRMLLTVQKEVGERVAAPHSCRDYGAYSVLIQRFWNPKLLKLIPPDSFFPKPNVDSALVLLDRKRPHEILRCDASSLDRYLRLGFAQRRKQLRKLLSCSMEQWETLAEKIGFQTTARPENLSVAQWQQLAYLLATDVVDHSPADGSELFDVVDEQDNVVECLSRSEVHARYLRHRAAHILLSNKKGEFFLQRRAPWKEINPDVWDSSAAGHIDSGESYEQAAHRELLEELGVDAPLKKIGKLSPCRETGNEFIEIYFGSHEGPFHLAGLEITGGAFFPLPQIRNWAKARPQDFSPVFLLCLQHLPQ